MGCGAPKPVDHSEVQNPCNDIITMLSEHILSSKNNLPLLESAFFFLNQILEVSKRTQKEFSKVMSDQLKEFQLNLPQLTREKEMKLDQFLKYLLPVETAFNGLFPEKAFNLQTKIKTNRTFSDSLPDDVDFFLIEAGHFWVMNFAKNDTCTWQNFFNKFTTSYMSIFDKDLEFLPAEKKPEVATIKENLILMMKNELETNNNNENNNSTVTKEGWNAFSFYVLFNFAERERFVEKVSVSKPKITNNKILLTLIYKEKKLLAPNEQRTYRISQNTVEDVKEEKIDEKDLLGWTDSKRNKIKVGRNVKDNDIVVNLGSVSRSHFEIVMKRNLVGENLINEYYLSNVSKYYTTFVVENDGYLLAKNMLVSLSENVKFCVKDLHPGFSSKTEFLSIEPQFLGHERKDPKMLSFNKKPFIDLEFYDERKKTSRKESKSVSSDEEDFLFNIGNGENDTIKLSDILEQEKEEANDGEQDEEEEEQKEREIVKEELIEPNHCQIKYDSKNKCWIVKDQTVVQPGNKTIFKTFILCYNNGQYEEITEGGEFQGHMRGIKLVKGMKIYFGDVAFSINEEL